MILEGVDWREGGGDTEAMNLCGPSESWWRWVLWRPTTGEGAIWFSMYSLSRDGLYRCCTVCIAGDLFMGMKMEEEEEQEQVLCVQ